MTNKPVLPTAIQYTWVANLTSCVVRDVRLGLFGARRHALDNYDIVYRLDDN